MTIPGNPTCITDDPATAMEGVSIAVFMNPAFTHNEYLKQLEPFVQAGLILVALPGQTGKWKIHFWCVSGVYHELYLNINVIMKLKKYCKDLFIKFHVLLDYR